MTDAPGRFKYWCAARTTLNVDVDDRPESVRRRVDRRCDEVARRTRHEHVELAEAFEGARNASAIAAASRTSAA